LGPPGEQPTVRAGEAVGGSGAGQGFPAAPGEGHRGGKREQLLGLARRQHGRRRGLDEGVSEADERGRQRDPVGGVDQGDFVVGVDTPGHVLLVHPADADHPIGGEFSGTQRPHAGGPDDGDPVVKEFEDLLVPDGRDLVPQPVDDQDGVVTVERMAEQVAVPHRRMDDRSRGEFVDAAAREGGACEDMQ
jgi:hypothetical protein